MAYGLRDPFLEGQPGPGPGPNPLGPVMEPGLRAIIYSVQHHLCSQSVFFADRMLNAAASLDAFGTNSPAAVALELWADTLLRAGEYEQVRWQLRGKNLSPRLQYLLAVACIKLEQFQEAQVALLGGDLDLVELWSSHGHLSSLDHVVEGAAGLYQLGQVAEGLRKREQAYECYAKCLKLCPFMWCAFERLSWLSLCLRNKAPSQNPREFAAGVFEHDRLMKNDILFPQSEVCKAVTPSEKCGFRTPRKRRRSGSLHSMPSAQSAKSLSPFGPRFSPRLPLLDKNPVTPIRTWSPSKVRGVFSPQSLASPKSPKKCHRYTPGLPGEVPTEEPNQTHIVHPIDSIDSTDSIMHRMRKTVCNVCNTVRSDTGCSGCSGCSGCRGRGKGGDENGDSLRSFSTLLQGLGEALHSLHRFRCQEAIDAVKTLHLNEQRSAFCEDLVARCHFEMQNYEETVRSYGRCCVQHRFFRSFGFEYFSTALWQLGDRLELGNLSRQVLEWGRSRPRAWCVLGNCFSLNNEAEEAIKFFKRAIQLDPNLVYAYSLIGHELVSMEKYEKAIEMFQAAIDLDPRQYNAWWGLGDVFQRQEDFAQAKYNFLRALDINPSNQVLKISLGAVLQEMGQANEALQLLSSAGGAVSSSRALAFLQKGRLLCLKARHSEAVEELRRACYLAPKEPGIHFHLGCACRSLGDSVTALKHFTFALDLANDRHLTDATRKELRELRGQSA